MVSLIGIIAGIAIVLAVIVTAGVVAVCLVLRWLIKPGGREASQPGQYGQYGQYGPPTGAPGAPTAMRRPTGSRHRGGHGAPMGSRRR